MGKPLTLTLVFVVLACFAFNSVATRYLVNRALMDPAGVTIARFISGAAMLALLLALQGKFREALPRIRDWPTVLFLGLYALAIGYGYRYITAAAGTFVFYALVIVTMTAGGARPTPGAISGAIIALAGVGVLTIGRVAGTSFLGVILLALTGLSWGVYSLLLRRRGTPLITNARAFLGLVVLLPLLAWAEGEALIFSPMGWVIGIFMGAITTSLAYALWARLLPVLTPIEAGTYQLIVPVMTAMAGLLALNEPFSFQLAVAGTLVLSGMWLTTRSGARQPSPAVVRNAAAVGPRNENATRENQ